MSGSGEIGAVLRDPSGEVKITFSKPVGVADSNLAEVWAVKEALTIFLASRWKDEFCLIIESDSLNAVKWIVQPDTALWKMRQWLIQFEHIKENLIGWEIRHVLRKANQRADTLAKERCGFTI